MQSSTSHPELSRLDAYRLDKDLSYRELAAEVGIPYRTLYGLLTNDDPQPFDRTLHKIQRFLIERSAWPAPPEQSAGEAAE
jgi:transcriptional regulator with XRE-family HTH domain